MLQNRFLCDTQSMRGMLHMKGISVMPYAHVHPTWELYLCPGTVRQRSVINGVEYTYRYPCAILSKPYTVHSMSCLETDGTDYERFVFYFTDEEPSPFGKADGGCEQMRDAQGLLFSLTEEQAEYLCAILRSADDRRFPPTDGEWACLLAFVLSRLFDFCTDDAIIRVGSCGFYAQDVMRYISEHLSEPLGAEAIARQFAVSRSTLERDFKRGVGMTLHEFVEICRLHYAKRLLYKKQSLPLSEISTLCGFRNDSYFYAFFKKHVGLSPAEYRRMRDVYEGHRDESGQALC